VCGPLSLAQPATPAGCTVRTSPILPRISPPTCSQRVVWSDWHPEAKPLVDGWDFSQHRAQ
jgi:hypothetical protein